MDKHELLRYRQSLPLDLKVALTEKRIKEWYYGHHGQVYVAFSGGRDSTVLLSIVRSLFPDVPGVFNNTGLEFPEIVSFVKKFTNIEELRPAKSFKAVIEEYGFPVISKDVSQKLHEIRTTSSGKLLDKRLYGDSNGNGKLPKKWLFLADAPFKVSDRCCDILKKNPAKKYEKRTGRFPFIGTMACESAQRKISAAKYGCNAFNMSRPQSRPLIFWTEEDISVYIKDNNIQISNIYKSRDRTGCMFCMFGVHMENRPNRFQRMKDTHPKQYHYCMEVLGLREILEYIGIPHK